MFADWARMLNVDADGSTSANLPRLGHTRCRRPIFPLDQGVELKGEVEVYRRTGDQSNNLYGFLRESPLVGSGIDLT